MNYFFHGLLNLFNSHPYYNKEFVLNNISSNFVLYDKNYGELKSFQWERYNNIWYNVISNVPQEQFEKYIEKGREARNQFNFLPHAALVFSSLFNASYHDLDEIAIRYNDWKNILNADNTVMMLKDYLKSLNIKSNDVIFYSIMRKEQSVDLQIKYNLQLIEYLYSFSSNIYIGGNTVRYLPKTYTLIRGLDVSKLVLNNKSQKLPLELVDYSNFKVDGVVNNSLSYENQFIFRKFNLSLSGTGKVKYCLLCLKQNYGCLGACAYCASSNIPQNFNVQKVQTSLELLHKLYEVGYNAFISLDCSLTEPKLFEMYYDFVQKHNMKIYAFGGVRLKDINNDVAKAMREINFVLTNIGVETLDDKMLKYINKNITVYEIREKLKILHKHDIFTNCNFIIDMPYSKEGEIHRIKEFVDSFEDGTINGVVINSFFWVPNSLFGQNPGKYNLQALEIKKKFYIRELNGRNTFVKMNQKHINTVKDYIQYKRYPRLGDYTHLIFALYQELHNKKNVWEYYKKVVPEIM